MNAEKYLRVIPGAPRTHGDSPPSWDWLSEVIQESNTAGKQSTPSDDSAFGDDSSVNQLQVVIFLRLNLDISINSSCKLSKQNINFVLSST